MNKPGNVPCQRFVADSFTPVPDVKKQAFGTVSAAENRLNAWAGDLCGIPFLPLGVAIAMCDNEGRVSSLADAWLRFRI